MKDPKNSLDLTLSFTLNSNYEFKGYDLMLWYISMFKFPLECKKQLKKHRYDSREVKQKEVGKVRGPGDPSVVSGVWHQTLNNRRLVGWLDLTE